MNKRSEIKGSYFRTLPGKETQKEKKEAEVVKDSRGVAVFFYSYCAGVVLQPSARK